MTDLVPVVLVKNEEYFLPYCLESVAGHFDRMVIYDVGSEDRTPEIIRWFVDKEKHRTDFFVRMLPHCPPVVQGTFRNSMIAEALSDYYFILDGDEVYTSDDLKRIKQIPEKLARARERFGDPTGPRKLYGLVRRMEFSSDLRSRYSVEREHHRVYRREAIWQGTHPGEAPVFPQNRSTELDCREDAVCYHFHNTLRSPKEADTPSRMRRKQQHSYHPGQLEPFDLLAHVPILRGPIANWTPAPALKELWR